MSTTSTEPPPVPDPTVVNDEAQSPKCDHRSCPICGCENTSEPSLNYSQDEWTLKQCSQCDLVYLENAPSYEALESEFAWEKTYHAEKSKRRKGKALRYLVSDAAKKVKLLIRGHKVRAKEQRFIQRYIGAGRMLDVGCGVGRTLINLPPTITPFGIEISPYLADVSQKYCGPRGGNVVRNNAVDGMDEFNADLFDGIMMRAFLEHETEPRTLLNKARRVLRPGGRIIIKVPNYACVNRVVCGNRWCGFRFPDHVNYFTPSTLRRLVHEAGYRVVRFGWLNRFPLSDNMWMVIEKPKP